MATVFEGKCYRISFLTSRLIRLEYQEEGFFNDEKTTLVRFRDFETPSVIEQRSHKSIELDTEHVHLVYNEQSFSSHGLCIEIKGRVSSYSSTWHYGDQIKSLGGTARTLDEADGAVDMGQGIISRLGFSIIDDSLSIILTDDGDFYPRKHKGIDLYFFGYGHDYIPALKDFYKLSGHVPLLPRYALGNWWSRYHEYSEESYLQLVDKFKAFDIPLSVAVIDMDWHLTNVPYGSGWTGYTWNKDLFPNPEKFLAELHNRGLYATLNLHPAGGVQPHEEAYIPMCKALNKDPNNNLAIDFDVTDKEFLSAYLQYLHHPLEKQGVDFWWIDWQQGNTSAIEGLDPLWVLNNLHYTDMEKQGKRALILSRYGGPGSHRYPAGFSGDTIMSWESLAFAPEFTATASNIGYPWWSHDIGGHMQGIRNDELSLRWLQFGVFSPILRLHSSKMRFASKEPWSYGKEVCDIMGDYLRLRHRLIPYIYTAAEKTNSNGENLINPLYYNWSEYEESYNFKNQYMFGESLMVCPICTPISKDLQLASQSVWLPPNTWFDFETGQIYNGDRIIKLFRTIKDYPVLAKAGGIVPLSDDIYTTGNPKSFTLRIFAGDSNEFELYEDDGISLNSNKHKTKIALDWKNKFLKISTWGDISIIPENRIWNIECIGFANTNVYLNNEKIPSHYQADRNALCFKIYLASTTKSLCLSFDNMRIAQDNWLKRAEDRIALAQIKNMHKERIWELLCKKGRKSGVLGTIKALCENGEMAPSLEEVLEAQGEINI